MRKLSSGQDKESQGKEKENTSVFPEIKFSLAGDNTRLFILKELAKYQIRIYALIIDKQGRKIKDDPENYAFLIEEILKIAIRDNPKLNHILIDKHFTFITQRERFNLHLQRRFGSKLFIEHVDSLQNPIITLADFVAGAIRVAYVKQNFQFKDSIKNLIEKEEVTTWKKIKSGKT